MRSNAVQFFVVFLTLTFITGCATTRAKRPDPVTDLNNQVTQLQSEVQQKDLEIQELQSQLESYKQAVGTTSSYSGNRVGKKSKIIKVSGVSTVDVQNALKRAGYDPGPIDGAAGHKTKSSIKQFQRDHGLTADGIVGEKTWPLLNKS